MGLIRSATALDAAPVRALLGQLGYTVDVSFVEGRLSSLPTDPLPTDPLPTDPLTQVLVIEADGVVVGVASLHAFDLFHQPGRIGRITTFVIDAAARGRGEGTALLAAVDAWFRRVGCVRAEVTSGDHRSAAHAFYESRGYLPEERRFLKRFE